MNAPCRQLTRILFLGYGLAILLFYIWGCSGDGRGLDPNGDLLGPCLPDTTISFSCDIQPIFDRSCSCHLGAGAPHGLDLSGGKSYGNLVNVPSAELSSLDRVEPVEPDTSYLAWKIEGDPRILGGRMPLGGPYLDNQTIALIRKWILQGAPNN
jgi:hypothetical protein